MPWVGGTKWNAHIVDTRQASREIRALVMLLQDDLDDLRMANRGNPKILNYLLTLATKLVAVSAQLDIINTNQDILRDIGADAKNDRTEANNGE